MESLCKELFEETIGKSNYDHLESVKWNKTLVESITEGLVGMSRPFKYCVSCIIMESGGKFGLNVANTCYWDKQTDQSYSVRWENGKSVVAVCTVFAVNYA